jgi:hypothetical protein
VDTTRDLSSVDPWQESLERSLARRRRDRTRVSVERDHRSQAARSRERRRRGARRRPPRGGATTRILLALVAAASLVLGIVVAKLTDGSSHHSVGLSLAHANVDGFRTPEGSSYSSAVPAVGGAASQRAVQDGKCHPVVPAAGSTAYTGYVNPLAGARVTPERIDQGVDYAGTGSLTALGAARITHVATSGTGWPGAFIAYKLLAGPDRGCTVYYAEGVRPVAGLRVGETIAAGRPIATLIPGWSTGIEIGWGAGVANKTYAALKGQWNSDDDADSIPSPAGKSFSSLISALGGVPGKVEG